MRSGHALACMSTAQDHLVRVSGAAVLTGSSAAKCRRTPQRLHVCKRMSRRQRLQTFLGLQTRLQPIPATRLTPIWTCTVLLARTRHS